jgi:hypothetical protein
MSLEQRDDIVRWIHPLDPQLTIISARTKHNRRYRALAALDGNKILKEWFPLQPDNLTSAINFLDGYGVAKGLHHL